MSSTESPVGACSKSSCGFIPVVLLEADAVESPEVGADGTLRCVVVVAASAASPSLLSNKLCLSSYARLWSDFFPSLAVADRKNPKLSNIMSFVVSFSLAAVSVLVL